MPQTSQKSPHPIDKHVGSRIRMRRALLGMTQQRLADSLHLTFQQVQKYEKGTNRVSASRLQQIATLLGVEVGFFYEGAGQVPGGSSALDRQSALLAEVSSSSEGVRLINSFARITDPIVRRRLADLAEGIAQLSASEPAAEQPRQTRGRMKKAS
ncbi:MAG TPA: helix-turn-helix domain-containing protein [Microvirga sp.]|nr:helix-turn-helix domain-containing protein [Microvirga sp.]